MNARRAAGRLLIIVTCGLVLAGCATGATPTSAPPASSPAPTIASPPAARSARLTLPANWTEVEMTEAGIHELELSVRESNPELASYLDQMIATDAYKDFLFWAYGNNGVEPIGAVTITVNPAQGLTLDSAEPALIANLALVPGISELRSSRVKLPIGDALLFTSEILLTPSDGSPPTVTSRERMYVVIERDDMYGVNVSCDAQMADACLKDVEAMILTLTIGL